MGAVREMYEEENEVSLLDSTPAQAIAVMVLHLVLAPVIEALNLTAGHTIQDTRLTMQTR